MFMFDSEVKRIRTKMSLMKDQAVGGTTEITLPFECEKIDGRIHHICPKTGASILYVLLSKKDIVTEDPKPRIKHLGGTSTGSSGTKRSYQELLTVQQQNIMYKYEVMESPGESTRTDEDSQADK